jgi:hypothetical protein
MNRSLFIALIATGAACAPAFAARPAGAPAPAAAAAAAAAAEAAKVLDLPTIKVGPYQLQNRSAFALPGDTRTPMWPIGWVRPAGELPRQSVFAPTPGGAGFQLQPHHLHVSSILMLSGEPLATINGRAFGEGEVLPVYVGERPIKVTVKAIRDGVVIVEQNGRQIICPIQRKGVPEKASDPQQPVAESFKIKITEGK